MCSCLAARAPRRTRPGEKGTASKSFEAREGPEVGGFCCHVPPERRIPLGCECYNMVVVGTYKNSPITAEQYRAKGQPLHARRSYFGPTAIALGLLVVEPPGTAPGSDALITKPFIAIDRPKPNKTNIGGGRG